MAGLDEWIPGHYGEDQYDDLYCPECGANVDKEGYHEIDGHFGSHVIFQCDNCGTYVLDGEWLNKTDAREKFA